MLKATTVTTEQELIQIHELNLANLKTNLASTEQKEEGFVTWLYSVLLLQQMHQLAPSIIIKDQDQVAGYALTTLRQAAAFHPDLKSMFESIGDILYEGKPLSNHNFYCMGQICIGKTYRGKGLVNMLYQKHKEVYGKDYDFILTEISTANQRSQAAHEKIGFKTIYTHRDAMDEWNVVVWDWN
ncbi:MAG TPA: GNAT family N-acetyltransferase [Flavisolibacter sp.]|nr:GNAT family N-acetyltransferase [Flavisolibacter sp.]